MPKICVFTTLLLLSAMSNPYAMDPSNREDPKSFKRKAEKIPELSPTSKTLKSEADLPSNSNQNNKINNPISHSAGEENKAAILSSLNPIKIEKEDEQFVKNNFSFNDPKEKFEKALTCFKNNNFEQAFTLFRQVSQNPQTLPSDRAAADLCQAQMRYSKRTQAITDEQAFMLCRQVSQNPQTLPSDRAAADLWQALMRHENRTQAITNEQAMKLLTDIILNLNVIKEIKIQAHQLMGSFLRI